MTPEETFRATRRWILKRIQRRNETCPTPKRWAPHKGMVEHVRAVRRGQALWRRRLNAANNGAHL